MTWIFSSESPFLSNRHNCGCLCRRSLLAVRSSLQSQIYSQIWMPLLNRPLHLQLYPLHPLHPSQRLCSALLMQVTAPAGFDSPFSVMPLCTTEKPLCCAPPASLLPSCFRSVNPRSGLQPLFQSDCTDGGVMLLHNTNPQI